MEHSEALNILRKHLRYRRGAGGGVIVRASYIDSSAKATNVKALVMAVWKCEVASRLGSLTEEQETAVLARYERDTGNASRSR